jgi:lipoyl(octanoyl) transferase
MNKVQLVDLGRMDYQEAWDYQERLFSSKLAIKSENRNLAADNQRPIDHHLLFVEHPHVYTLGKSGKPENLLLDEEGLASVSASYYKINRGGDITYHGPGQLVVYPILDLEQFRADIHWYMRSLEEVVIQTIGHANIHGDRLAGFTGVWLDPKDDAKARKICAMGVRTSRWVTMHGIALNVNTDLNYFDYIVPCGIDEKAVTSMQKENGEPVPIQAVKAQFLKTFEQIFDAEIVQIDLKNSQ